jgi:DNA-binding transcriptional ArsR family regulator
MPAIEDVDAEIVAAVEEQLAAQRAELTAKLLAEREERRRQEEAARAAAARAEETRVAEEARAAAATGFSSNDLAKFRRMLEASGVRIVPVRQELPADTVSEPGLSKIPDEDYSDTDRVQMQLDALLDLLGVVRVRDVQEHIRRKDGSIMSPSNVRYHMKKLANRGLVKKAEERYKLLNLGYRTRDVWSKDPQKLLEILEGKKIVRQ